jgi:membrane-associated protein
MNKVPYRTFLKWNAAGGIVFSSIVIVLGYEFANSLQSLEKYLKYWAIIFLVIVIMGISFLKRKLEKAVALN